MVLHRQIYGNLKLTATLSIFAGGKQYLVQLVVDRGLMRSQDLLAGRRDFGFLSPSSLARSCSSMDPERVTC